MLEKLSYPALEPNLGDYNCELPKFRRRHGAKSARQRTVPYTPEIRSCSEDFLCRGREAAIRVSYEQVGARVKNGPSLRMAVRKPFCSELATGGDTITLVVDAIVL